MLQSQQDKLNRLDIIQRLLLNPVVAMLEELSLAHPGENQAVATGVFDEASNLDKTYIGPALPHCGDCFKCSLGFRSGRSSHEQTRVSLLKYEGYIWKE